MKNIRMCCILWSISNKALYSGDIRLFFSFNSTKMKNLSLPSLFFLFFFCLSFSGLSQTGAVYIWGGPNSTGAEYNNSTFNGGLNDWTTEGVLSNGGVVDSAIWHWTADGSLKGAYWSDLNTIESPTVNNGAVGFDSDFLDNAGNKLVYGTGVAPAPQTGTLTSPSIDCTGESHVSVLFYESYLAHSAVTTLEVSHDGGANWTTYSIPYNDNGKTESNAWTYVNISNTAANQSDVRIRFVWNGEYYFWLLDDISLIQSPENDLAIADYDYPFDSYSQPSITGQGCDTLNFGFAINNVAQIERYNVVAKVEIMDSGGTLLYSDSMTIDTLPADATRFEAAFGDGWLPILDEGAYSFTYSVSDGQTDFNQADNVVTRPFVISHNTFAKGSGDAIWYPKPASIFQYGCGTFYNTCDFDNMTNGLEVVVDSFGFMVSGIDMDSLPHASVDAYICEVVDSVVGDWIELGHHSFEFTDNTQNETMLWITTFEDSTGVPTHVRLKPNSRYCAAMNSLAQNQAQSIGFGWTKDEHNAPEQALVLLDGQVYEGIQDSKSVPHFVLKLKFLVNTQLPKLDENAVRLLQNPVDDVLLVDLSFAQQTDVHYAIGSLTGSLLQVGQWTNVQKETYSVNTSRLPTGQYLLRIQTVNGVATKLFVVTR